MSTSHLEALELRRTHELGRLERASSDTELQLRRVWLQQIEKEIAAERAFLGLSDALISDLSDDEILAELTAGLTPKEG